MQMKPDPLKVRKYYIIILMAAAILALIGAHTGLGLLTVIGLVAMFGDMVFLVMLNRCPFCGKYLDRNVGRFCPHCGKALGEKDLDE